MVVTPKRTKIRIFGGGFIPMRVFFNSNEAFSVSSIRKKVLPEEYLKHVQFH